MRTVRATLVRLAAALAAVAPASVQAQAAEGTPAWVVEQYVTARQWDDRAKYLTGEMKQYAAEPTPGMTMPAEAVVTIRPLEADSASAVFAATVRVPAGTLDAYLYLHREGGRWRITAFRRLWLPPLFQMALDSLEAMPNRPAEYDRVLPSMRLTIASDSALKRHFDDHAADFHALAQAAVDLPDAHLPSAEPREGEGPLSPGRAEMRAALQRLGLSALNRDEHAPGCLLLVIGGMIDNSVGYLYAPAGCTVPRMSPGYFIYVEAVRPGWYLYKTT